MCQVTSPEKFSFSRYGLKGGRKWGFSRFSENLDSRFGSISYKRKISSFYMFVSSFESKPFFVLEIWGKRGSKMGFFKVFSKLRLTIWFHLLEKNDIIILHIRAKYRVQTIFVLEIWDKRGSKMRFFKIFSKTALTISFYFLQKEDITVFH